MPLVYDNLNSNISKNNVPLECQNLSFTTIEKG